MAYIDPITPIMTTVIHNPSDLLTPKASETPNRLSMPMAPEYNTIGSKVTTKEKMSMAATIVLVIPSNLLSKNCGMVVSPIFKYLGTKKMAAITNAIEEVTSQAITIKPFT